MLVIQGKFEEFKEDILKGISKTPAYCVEIFEKAFGNDYRISLILYKQLTDMFEQAIKELLEGKQIAESNTFKNMHGKVTVYTTSYKRISSS